MGECVLQYQCTFVLTTFHLIVEQIKCSFDDSIVKEFAYCCMKSIFCGSSCQMNSNYIVYIFYGKLTEKYASSIIKPPHILLVF